MIALNGSYQFFSRFRLANKFLENRLIDFLQVFYRSRFRMQASHRIFVNFICCSYGEPMLRNNLFFRLCEVLLGLFIFLFGSLYLIYFIFKMFNILF